MTKVLCSKITLQDGGLYNIETSALICSVHQWTCFCMIETTIMKELTAIVCV